MKKTLLPFIVSIIGLVIFHIIISISGFHVGSITQPTPSHAYTMLQWGIWGSLVAISMTLLFCRTDKSQYLLDKLIFHPSQNRYILFWIFFIFYFVVILRITVFKYMPITDDEACYQFMADLLASGRLKTTSHPAKLFFDHVFMINDGTVYSQYFIGWPIFLLADRLLGSFGFINGLYAALTVLPLYFSAKILLGERWSRISVLLYATAPMVLFGASTKLSHTSCILFLTLTLYAFLRLKNEDRIRNHLLFIISFSVAFFIRPYSTIAFALPLFVLWIYLLFKKFSLKKLYNYTPAVITGFLALCIFLIILKLQTGRWLTTAYKAYVEYSIANALRFSFTNNISNLTLMGLDPIKGIKLFANGIIRTNFDLFGWPCSLIFICFTPWIKRSSIIMAIATSFFIFTAFGGSAGIDTYGPVKFSEFIIPLVLLSVFGMKYLSQLIKHLNFSTTTARKIPILFMLSLIISGWLGYTSIRINIIKNITSQIEEVWTLTDILQQKSVIFVPTPVIRKWDNNSGNGFVFQRPENDPDLDNPILWINHLTIEDDKKLIKNYFPNYTGYVLIWIDQQPSLLLLDLVPPSFPKGRIGGSEQSINWEDTTSVK